MGERVVDAAKLEDIKKKAHQYDYIRFSLCDLNGTYRGQVVVSRHVDHYLEKGVDIFEGILVAGPRSEIVLVEHENNFNFGSMKIIPDLDTFRSIPWAKDGFKVAELLCESQWKKTNTPQAACPRYVARQQLRRLSHLGLDLYSGYELEFTVYEKDSLRPIFTNIGYCQREFSHCSNILFDFDRNFVLSGLDVERYHCEMSKGMFEAITKPKYGIQGPDMVMNLKQSFAELADQKNLVVSFMSKQQNNSSPSGHSIHFNFSVWDKSGKNMFYDADSPDKLSAYAKYWIAGILKHAKALCAFSNPTVNCYRRLHQDFFISNIFWGIEDRLSCLRVKNYGPDETYFENRLPSGKSNTYLVVAATIAAGLDGVDKKMECPPPGQPDKGESLPHSLSEALDELEADADLVNALGKELVEWFVKCKRDGEIIKYAGVDTDEEKFEIEREKYFA